MRYSSLVIISMFSALRLTAQEYTTYTSPAGFYTIVHPKSWLVLHPDDDFKIDVGHSDKNMVNITSPDGTGAVTISGFHGDFTPQHLHQLVDRTFKDYQTLSALKPNTRDDSTGLIGEFLQVEGGERRIWLARAWLHDHVMVFITANDTEAAMKTRRQIYTRILDSLILRDPDAH